MKNAVSFSPHIRHSDSTRGIMLDVIISLLPASVVGIAYFGWRAAVMILVCVGFALLSEAVWCKIFKKKLSIGDLSAAVTGLLLALNLPSEMPFWMAAVGSTVAIIVVKQMFGGLGNNFVNPAIAARIVLMVSWTAAMSKYALPFNHTITSATPLADLKSFNVLELLLGTHGGTIGETCAIALLLGGAYLMIRRVITWHIPVAFVATLFVLNLVTGGDAVREILAGGLLLGAIFMATDYVTSPPTYIGKIIYAIGCGIITFVIRRFGSLPEGVSFSIIIMNILTPHINSIAKRFVKPFGWEEGKR